MFLGRRASGTSKDEGAALEWRVRLLGAGAILGLAGMWAEQGWMINLAIAVLVVGFLLRFTGRGDPTGQDPRED